MVNMTNGTHHFRTLSDEQLELVNKIDYGNRVMWRALLLILCNYGTRISEALLIRWKDVNFTDHMIALPILKRRKAMSRTLPLYPVVESALLDLHPTGRPDQPGRVFKITRGSAWRGFQTILKRAGLEGKPLHDLRHTCATRIATVTRDPLMVRDILGHANVATSNIYLHAVNLHERMLQVPTIG